MDFVKDLVLGGTSGVIAKTICAPLERVKIVLQTSSANAQLAGGQQYNGIVQSFRKIAAEQGVFSFWQGYNEPIIPPHTHTHTYTRTHKPSNEFISFEDDHA
jgi:solute carrier family 25 (adenine nucleotide translocator) protein 4/5/6/31